MVRIINVFSITECSYISYFYDRSTLSEDKSTAKDTFLHSSAWALELKARGRIFIATCSNLLAFPITQYDSKSYYTGCRSVVPWPWYFLAVQHLHSPVAGFSVGSKCSWSLWQHPRLKLSPCLIREAGATQPTRPSPNITPWGQGLLR